MAKSGHMSPAVRERLRHLKALSRRDSLEPAFLAIEEATGESDPSADVLLLSLLDDRNPCIREEVVTALRSRGGPLARLGARAASQDPDSLVRNAAVEALGEIGERRDVRWLLAALKDASWVVRASTATSLGNLGGARAKRALLDALVRDPHPVVRRDAAEGLIEIGDETVVPLLEHALTGEAEETAQGGILFALYSYSQSQCLAPFLQLLHSVSDPVRHQTVNMIHWHWPEKFPKADRPEIIAALRQMIAREGNPGVQGDAERALAAVLAQET